MSKWLLRGLVFAALMVIVRLLQGAMINAWETKAGLISAVLVILFFMHVIHSTRLTWVVVIGSFLWLCVLFVLMFSDYLTRLWGLT